MKKLQVLLLLFPLGLSLCAQKKIDKDIESIQSKVIEWRRYFHQHPELSNREFKTAEKIAEHLNNLGMQVRTGVLNRVVGILHGKRPGKVIALRADIDALPVTERVDLPFKSTVVTELWGNYRSNACLWSRYPYSYSYGSS